MAAIRARTALPWYRRTWWQWPPVAQVFSLLVVSTLLGTLTWVCLHAGREDVAGSVGIYLTEVVAVFAPVWSLVSTLGEATALILKQVPLLAWAGIVAFLGTMYLFCIGLGTALYRIALPRRHS